MKTKYGIDFVTKKEFVKWIEEHLNEIDFDENVLH